MIKPLIVILFMLVGFSAHCHEQPKKTPSLECPGDVPAFNLPTQCVTGMTDVELQRFGQLKQQVSSRYGEMLAAVIETYQVELTFAHFAGADQRLSALIDHTIMYHIEHCRNNGYRGPLPVGDDKAHQRWVEVYGKQDICIGLEQLGYKIGDEYFAFDFGSETALVLQFSLLASGRATAMYKYSNDFGRQFVAWGVELIRLKQPPC